MLIMTVVYLLLKNSVNFVNYQLYITSLAIECHEQRERIQVRLNISSEITL